MMPTPKAQSLSKSYTVFTQHREFYFCFQEFLILCSRISNCHCRVLITYQKEKESDFTFFWIHFLLQLQEKDLRIPWKKCFNPCWEHRRCCYSLLPKWLLLLMEYLSLDHIHKYFGFFLGWLGAFLFWVWVWVLVCFGFFFIIFLRGRCFGFFVFFSFVWLVLFYFLFQYYY